MPDSPTHIKPYLTDYFVSVALGSEFENDFSIVKKWATPMKIYISGLPPQYLIEETYAIIEGINLLVTDGFYTEIVQDSSLLLVWESKVSEIF